MHQTPKTSHVSLKKEMILAQTTDKRCSLLGPEKSKLEQMTVDEIIQIRRVMGKKA